MSIMPTAYTETQLAQYMDNILGPVADAMGWVVVDGDYDEAVISSILTYGVDDVSTVSGSDNITKLRAIARVEAWRAVRDATAGHYDFSDGGVSLKRSQMHAQAVTSMLSAEAEAMQFGVYGNEVYIDTITYIHDPYRYLEDDDRVIAP